MRFPPLHALLVCLLLLAGSASAVGGLPGYPFRIRMVDWECDPYNHPTGCVECDLSRPLEPCRPRVTVNPAGCVPNTVEPRNMRPSDMADRCIPPLPGPEDFPEPTWTLPIWGIGQDEYALVLETLDGAYEEVAPLLP